MDTYITIEDAKSRLKISQKQFETLVVPHLKIEDGKISEESFDKYLADREVQPIEEEYEI